MNFYQFHIGDYIKQTVHLTPMEDICYRRLLDMYYETEQPIPTETDRVSRRLRLDTELVDSVLKEFFTLTERGWENARCEGEINAYHVKADTARSNGKLGGRPKKTKSVSDRNPAESGSKANHEPLTINQYIKPSSPDKPDDGFAEFWKAYPRKVGKGAALKAWAKIKSKADTLQAILKAIAWQRTADQWTKDGGQFIPHPSTWLNEQRWLDEAPTKASTPIPFDREAYEAKRKVELAAARERYQRDQEAASVPVGVAK
jgi:uncharacterized protein YdaU (DUF1376 family)